MYYNVCGISDLLYKLAFLTLKNFYSYVDFNYIGVVGRLLFLGNGNDAEQTSKMDFRELVTTKAN